MATKDPWFTESTPIQLDSEGATLDPAPPTLDTQPLAQQKPNGIEHISWATVAKPSRLGPICPVDPAEIAFRAAELGLKKDAALALALRAAGLALPAPPSPALIKEREGRQGRLKTIIEEIDDRLEKIPPLRVIAWAMTSSLFLLGAGLGCEGLTLGPALSQLDNDPIVQVSLAIAAIGGAAIAADVAIEGEVPFRWPAGVFAGSVTFGGAVIRALYATPLGLSLLGYGPGGTSQTWLALGCQGLLALATASGALILATAGIHLARKTWTKLVERMRLNRAKKARVVALEALSMAASSEAASRMAAIRDYEIASALAELGWESGHVPTAEGPAKVA